MTRDFFHFITGAGVPEVETWGFAIDSSIPVEVAEYFGKSIKAFQVTVVTDEALLEMNKKFLQHDYYTDVITFDYSESGDSIEGEVYCSYDRIRDNAATYKVSFRKEFERVIIHAVLHLCGMKDHSEEEAGEMRRMESLFLK